MNPQFPPDLVTFMEEILNGKLHFLCSGMINYDDINDITKSLNILNSVKKSKTNVKSYLPNTSLVISTLIIRKEKEDLSGKKVSIVNGRLKNYCSQISSLIIQKYKKDISKKVAHVNGHSILLTTVTSQNITTDQRNCI